MSAPKHTPGPWAIVRDRQHPSNRRINSPKRWHIAKVYAEGPEDDPVCLANARLIAAAPTMFDYIANLAAAGDPEAARIVGVIHGDS